MTAITGIACLAAFLLSLLTGPVAIAPGAALDILAGGGDPLLRTILIELRLPRAILGCAIGATLGLGGAVLQGYLRNPLAAPDLLGSANAAALGAVAVLAAGLAGTLSLMLPATAIVASLVATLLLVAIAGRDPRPVTLVLAGLALTTFLGACVALVLNLAPNPFLALEVAFWLLGSLTDRSMVHVAIALPFLVASWVALLSVGPALSALSLGEDTARSLGVPLARTRLLVVGGVAVGIGAAVAVSGVIGFVGLVVPHLVRPFVGNDPARTLLPSALLGGALLTLADVVVRLLPGFTEIRLGVVTALVGAPFFFVLILRERRFTGGLG